MTIDWIMQRFDSRIIWT